MLKRKRDHSSTSQLNPLNWGIRNKILVLVLSVLVIVVVSLGVINYSIISQNAIEQTSYSLITLGREASQELDNTLTTNIKGLQVLAMTPSVVEIVNKANQVHQLEDNLERKISELDEAWKAEDPAVAPLVKEISSNHVSLYLKDSLGILSDEVEIFLTDSYGLNVAMTDRTSDYFQADEGWWQRAYNDGQGAIYISDIEFDESTQTWALDIGMPIRNNEGQEIVGIIRGTLDVSSLFQHFSQFTMGETGQVSIVDKEGKILYTREHDQFLQTISEELLTTIQLDDQGLSTQVNNLAGKPAIVTYRRSDNELVNSLGLTVIVDQELYEVNKYVRTSFRQTLLATAIISIVLLIIIFWIARFISNPLLLATQEAQDLSMGKLSGSVYEDENLYLHHTDEVGKLLGAFQILREYIREIALSAQKLATGNLTITVQSRHEHDQLGNAFNLMISSLRHLISQVARDADDVKEVAGQVAAASEQSGSATQQIANIIQQMAASISSQNESVMKISEMANKMDDIVGQVSRGTQQQKEAVNQSTLTVDQISESIQQVTRNAKIGTQGAAQAAEIARKGVSIVEANLEGMYRIKNKVDLSTTRIQEMSDWSIQIGTIIETINNLASQTNLLALNAAIEAARAGEHGKGFAVVADEVRKLAEKSTQSTKEIASLIYGIQETANEAVTAMGEGSKEVDEGVALANEAGQALSEILQASEAVHEQVERIAVAAQEMDTHSNNLVDTVSNVSAVVEENVISVKALTAGFNEVHTAVNSVVSISQENSASAQEVGAAVEQISAQVEEISASAQYLNKMSLELQILTNKFQLTAEDENFVVPTEEQEKNNLIEDWYKKLPLAISE